MRVSSPVATLMSNVVINADIDMDSHKLTSLSAGSEDGHSLRREQVIDVFLPLAGGTMAGDLNIGAHKLKTTNCLIREEADPAFMGIRNAADDDYRSLVAHVLDCRSYLSFTSGGSIRARNYDDAAVVIQARNNTVGLAEVARYQGAADPYFQATLPMVLKPSATPGALVEGHFWYREDEDRLAIKDATITRYINPVIPVASTDLQSSNDAEKTTTNNTYTKLKETKIDGYFHGVKAHFELERTSGAGTVTAALYKNGTIEGTPITRATSGWLVSDTDLTGLVKDDLIQVYAKNDDESSVAKVRYLRLQYTWTPVVLPVTNQDPA